MSDGVRKPLRTNGLARAARERQRFRRRKRDRGGNREGASGGHHRKHGWHCLGGPCPEKFSGEPPCFFQTQALHGVPRRNRATTGMIAAVDRRRRLHRRSRQCRAKCWRAPQECAHECRESCNGQCAEGGAVADALVRRQVTGTAVANAGSAEGSPRIAVRGRRAQHAAGSAGHDYLSRRSSRCARQRTHRRTASLALARAKPEHAERSEAASAARSAREYDGAAATPLTETKRAAPPPAPNFDPGEDGAARDALRTMPRP